MKNWLKSQWREYKLLLKSLPSLTLAIFVLTVFTMNLLANKSWEVGLSWVSFDCGFIVSWIAFLTMDVLTKHYGAKGATQVSFTALAISLVACFVMWCASKIKGVWGESLVYGGTAIDDALNNTVGGNWYVVLGSATAFALSTVVNNFTNHGLGLLFKQNPNGFVAYATRTYLSTALGQFVDNLVFALLVSKTLFGWSFAKCVACASLSMLAELIFEILFSFVGYKICAKWKKDGVGKQYLDCVNGKTNA